MIIDHFLVGVGTSTTHLFLTLILFIFTSSEKRRDFFVIYSQTEVETLIPLLSLTCGFYLLVFFFFFLRDLLNWCNRIAHSFDSLSSSASLNIFQEVRYIVVLLVFSMA